MELANRIRLARKKKHLSQDFMAEQLGVSRQAISRWENGQAQPSTKNIMKIATLLDITVDQLTGSQTTELNHRFLELEQQDNIYEEWIALSKEWLHSDLMPYQPISIYQAFQQCMERSRCCTVPAYMRLLSFSQTEREKFLRHLNLFPSIFFDDIQFYTYFYEQILPKLIQPDQPFRVWVLNIGAGEEVYTFAMLIAEYLEQHQLETPIRIFASTMEEKWQVETAAQGIFTKESVVHIPQYLRKKYFVATPQGWKVISKIRNMIVFSVHHIFCDPPFTNLDMIVCRRLIPVLRAMYCKKLFSKFSYSLVPKGALILQPNMDSDAILQWFIPDEAQDMVYYKKQDAITRGNLLQVFTQTESILQIQSLPLPEIMQCFFSVHCKNTILLDETMRILFAGEHIFEYLHLDKQSGDVLLDSCIEKSLMHIIQKGLAQLREEKKPIRLEQTVLSKTEKDTIQQIWLSAISQNAKWYYAVSFFEKSMHMTGYGAEDKMELYRQLQEAKEQIEEQKQQMQTMTEENITLREKLSSANTALASLSEEVYSLYHEMKILNQELKRFHQQE